MVDGSFMSKAGLSLIKENISTSSLAASRVRALPDRLSRSAFRECETPGGRAESREASSDEYAAERSGLEWRTTR
jgi:hypothetical protein